MDYWSWTDELIHYFITNNWSIARSIKQFINSSIINGLWLMAHGSSHERWALSQEPLMIKFYETIHWSSYAIKLLSYEAMSQRS